MDTLSLIKKLKALNESKGVQKHGQKSVKSRVKVYKTIDDALKKGHYGEVFSTKGAGRLYVVTRHKWGKSGQQNVNGKTAKGFTPGSAPSSFKDVKGYAKRTAKKYLGRK